MNVAKLCPDLNQFVLLRTVPALLFSNGTHTAAAVSFRFWLGRKKWKEIEQLLVTLLYILYATGLKICSISTIRYIL